MWAISLFSDGYLESDLLFDSENTPYVLMAVKDIVRVAFPVHQDRPRPHISDSVERGPAPRGEEMRTNLLSAYCPECGYRNTCRTDRKFRKEIRSQSWPGPLVAMRELRRRVFM